MNKKTITIGIAVILTMFTIVLASAYNLTAGESINLIIPEYSYYEITENSTEVDLNITQNGTNVTIEIGKYMETGSFILTFFNEKDEVIQQSSGGSSGGGGGGCITTWVCSEWSNCIDETQTRNCSKKISYCYAPKKDKPNETLICLEVPDEPIEPDEVDKPDTSTPKFVYFAPRILLGLIFIYFIIMIILTIKRKKKKLEQGKNENPKSVTTNSNNTKTKHL